MAKLPMKYLKTILIVIIFGVMIINSGCGGGSSDSSSSGIESISLTKGNVQLGPVQYSNVTISSLDGVDEIYTTVTDSEGVFEIDRLELKKRISNLSLQPSYLKIVATGGVDIDPDDDGVQIAAENIQLKGSVVGIIGVNDLLNKDEIYINLISTFLADALSGYDSLDEKGIQTVLNNIGMYDINLDGKVSLGDVVDYQMIQDDSQTEAILRFQYLKHVHQGNDALRRQYIDSLQYDKSYVTVIQKKESDGVLTINLKPLNKNNHIRFSNSEISENNSLPFIYTKQITLEKGGQLIYEECENSGACYKREVIYNTDNTIVTEKKVPNIPINYSDQTRINDLRNTYLKNKDLYLELQENINDWNLRLNNAITTKSSLQFELDQLEIKLSENAL